MQRKAPVLILVHRLAVVWVVFSIAMSASLQASSWPKPCVETGAKARLQAIPPRSLDPQWVHDIEAQIRYSNFPAFFQESMRIALRRWIARGESPLHLPNLLKQHPDMPVHAFVRIFEQTNREHGDPWVRGILDDPSIYRATNLERFKNIRIIHSREVDPIGGRILTEPVYDVRLGGRRFVLRTYQGVTKYGALRKNYAASVIAELIGIPFAPQATWAVVGNAPALLTDYIESPGDLRSINQFDPHSMSDLDAAAFFVGEMDGISYNIVQDPVLGPVGVDFDMAFLATVSRAQPQMLVGGHAPRSYSPRFIGGISRLERPLLQTRLRPFLSAAEIDWMLFRREVLLVDSERREK